MPELQHGRSIKSSSDTVLTDPFPQGKKHLSKDALSWTVGHSSRTHAHRRSKSISSETSCRAPTMKHLWRVLGDPNQLLLTRKHNMLWKNTCIHTCLLRSWHQLQGSNMFTEKLWYCQTSFDRANKAKTLQLQHFHIVWLEAFAPAKTNVYFKSPVIPDIILIMGNAESSCLWLCPHVEKVPGDCTRWLYVCMHACMHVCMYLCKYICKYVCIYACMQVRTGWLYVCLLVCMNIRICVCLFVCLYVCMYVCVHCVYCVYCV
jgi:hypothetical protein